MGSYLWGEKGRRHHTKVGVKGREWVILVESKVFLTTENQDPVFDSQKKVN